jgi:hypothetical protein
MNRSYGSLLIRDADISLNGIDTARTSLATSMTVVPMHRSQPQDRIPIHHNDRNYEHDKTLISHIAAAKLTAVIEAIQKLIHQMDALLYLPHVPAATRVQCNPVRVGALEPYPHGCGATRIVLWS